MRYKMYGQTGKKVSVLGFGGMRFDPDNEELAIQTVHRAVELGINYFDTAPGYCRDMSETFIGKAYTALDPETRDKIFLSTKSSIQSDPDADSVRKRIDDQLNKLGCPKIHFYHMWCLMNLDQYHKVMAPEGPLAGARKAQEEGLIEHIVCSAHASGEDIASMVQDDVFEGYTVGYNILNHTFRKKGIQAASAAGRAVITMNPLGGGLLTKNEQKLKVLQDDESDSFIAAALRFNFSHPEITIVLSGMKNPQEVEDNVRTSESISGPDPDVVQRIIQKFESLGESFCTDCCYCLEHCPEDIQINLYAALWDYVRMELPENAQRMYTFFTQNDERWFKGKRATDCTDCGDCEENCTQHLPIREFLANCAEFFGE